MSRLAQASLLVALLIFVFTTRASAQWVGTLQGNYALQQVKTTDLPIQVRNSNKALSLPFFDDFSYTGPFADPQKWIEKAVYVNQRFAINPPSLGVATFDGLDSTGTPYLGGYGVADRLTSRPIDLSRPPFDSVFLSFWLQPIGLGDRPEIGDSLVVEARNPQGNWEQLAGYRGFQTNVAADAALPFAFRVVPIPPRLWSANFQFRFTGYNERTGITDTWHLDYVHLESLSAGVQPDSAFRDMSFTQPPSSLLRRYKSMPWSHFIQNADVNLADTIRVHLRNNLAQAANASPSSVSIVETNSGAVVLDNSNRLFNNQDINIPNGVPVLRSYPLAGGGGFPNIRTGLLASLLGGRFDQQEVVDLELRYQLTNNSQQTNKGYELVLNNDRTAQKTRFDTYFGYDDGTAEAAFYGQTRRQTAIVYRAEKPDSIRGFRAHFPHTVVDFSNQVFDFHVWIGELDNTPEFTMRLVNPFYTDAVFDTLQGYSTYALRNEMGEPVALAVPKGDFYIGWTQASNCQATSCIAFGYDRNSPEGKDYFFVFDGLKWVKPSPSLLAGAIMLQPVFGQQTPGTTSTSTEIWPATWKIYPNPVTDKIVIEADVSVLQYVLQNSMGQIVKKGITDGLITCENTPSGVYWLRLWDETSGQQGIQKLIIR